MKIFNANGEILADYLNNHPAIETVFYPKFVNQDSYEAIKKPFGGYGSLMSIVTRNRALAPRVYDRLDVYKGPSLGTNYTLASPYTMLAHFTKERSWKARGLITICSASRQDLSLPMI